ncbi:MAG: histidine--tRNA ligase [Gemmatimonadota bacterium]
MTTASLPGFRDFFPDDFELRAHITSVWREVARRYGFEEYDGPPLEPLELYTQKSGEEIVGQLYGFTDRGGREVALRPEMTPTFARMVAARAAGLAKPIRWFSIPQLFRYERPQKGRLREHFQLNMDIVGERGALADVDLLGAAIDTLRAFGLGAEAFEARVSDRRLASALLGAAGVRPEGLFEAYAALDKLGRESEDRVRARLAGAGAGPDGVDRILALRGMDPGEVRETFADAAGVREETERLEGLLEMMRSVGLGDFVRFDATLVRGLAYYTGLVFELWDREGELRAICGGGRYDALLAALGGVDLPAVGFGMGDVVLGELLRREGLVPESERALEDYVICVEEDLRPLCLRIAHALRDRGRRVAFDYAGRAVGRQFKAAGQAGARRAIIVGPEEAAKGEVRIRDMADGEERNVTLEALIDGSGAGAPGPRD